MNFVRVESFPDLRKDINNGGVVNSNTDSYTAYLEKKKRILSEQAEKDAMKEEINNIKQDLSEIKQLLTLLMDRK
jgi:hypothetical protein